MHSHTFTLTPSRKHTPRHPYTHPHTPSHTHKSEFVTEIKIHFVTQIEAQNLLTSSIHYILREFLLEKFRKNQFSAINFVRIFLNLNTEMNVFIFKIRYHMFIFILCTKMYYYCLRTTCFAHILKNVLQKKKKKKKN